MSNVERIVDTHVHLYELANGWTELLAGKIALPPDFFLGDMSPILGRDYLVDQYMGDARGCNVTKLVYITVAQTPPSFPAETRWAQALADRTGFPHAFIGSTDLRRPVAEVDAELAEHAQSAVFRGIRNQESIDFGASHTKEVFKLLERRNLIYDTVAHDDTLPAAARLAAQYPGVKFVLEHTGWPHTLDQPTFERWRAGMRKMAECPNAFCKVSGLGMIRHPWTVDDIRPWVQSALEIFGVDRCLFGSNFPIDSLYSSFKTLVDAMSDITGNLSAGERDAFFAGNAERVYDI